MIVQLPQRTLLEFLAKKYLISSLAEKCCVILEASINQPENVFAVLEQAVHFDEKWLEEKSWDIVLRRTQECLNSEAFCDIGLHTLNALLKKESLAVTEVELFNAVLKWTDSECARQGINIEEDKTARRRVLGDSVYEIGFLEMSQEDIVKYVSRTKLLTYEEIVSVLQKLYGLDVADLKWKKHKRPVQVRISRFDPGNVSANTWIYSGKANALTLTVNKAVLFHGVRLFGNSRGSQYEVKFTVKDETVTGTYTSQEDGDSVPGYDVMLSKPIPLLPNEEITIIAAIKGPYSYWGTKGKSSVKIDDTVVIFTDPPRGYQTSGNAGQFYKVILSKL